MLGPAAALLPPKNSDAAFEDSLCAGATVTHPRLLHSLAALSESTAKAFAVPMYVLVYIWDGDEIEEDELGPGLCLLLLSSMLAAHCQPVHEARVCYGLYQHDFERSFSIGARINCVDSCKFLL